jgi:hypothetical protein
MAFSLGGFSGGAGLLRVLLSAATVAALVHTGCQERAGTAPRVQQTRLAPGVTARTFKQGLWGVRVIDVDLGQPGVRIDVAAEEIAVRDGHITGQAKTLPEWLKSTGAVAGINGGFFGYAVDEHRKEIVGLLKQAGRVRVAGTPRHSTRTGGSYTRCALGFTRAGEPRMAWVASVRGEPQALRAHAAPDLTGPGTPWTVRQALACGPRLLRDGKVDVSYRGERLASPGSLPRTFVGYGGKEGTPGHFVLCAADGMEFADCARFLAEYFQREYGVPCREGMCLDGGASTQAAWREAGRITTNPDPGTTVPTALLVYAGGTSRTSR